MSLKSGQDFSRELRSVFVVLFCEFCVRFTLTIVFVYLEDVHTTVLLVVQQYDMLY